MITIHKFPLNIIGENIIEMQEDAEILHVDVQQTSKNSKQIFIWVKIDTSRPLKYYKFFIYGTGFKIINDENLIHLGTVMMDNGLLVWHVFLDKESV